MDQDHLRTLLEQVRTGAVEIDAALERLRHLPYEDLGFAKVDHHRALRHGMPEVVFGKGKTPAQVSAIVKTLLASSQKRARHARRCRRRRPFAERTPGGRRIFSSLRRGAILA